MNVTSTSFRRRALFFVAIALLGTAGCGAEDAVRSMLEASLTPHERYAQRLKEAGLDSTALGRDWLRAASRAVLQPVSVTLPFRETGYLPPTEASAIAYRFSLRRGQKLAVRIDVAEMMDAALFVDIYLDPADSTEPPDRVESADRDERLVEYEARRDGDYLLRLQPELLRGGRYTLTLESGPSLAFPVAGRDSRAARSLFGAARDGGARSHHGIDIFAPRGTPVLAASNGVVRNVGTSNLGGKVVWLSDPGRRQSLYYAHLDSQIVRAGAVVKVGDTLGLVGNTGNARTTPPHLHFGIYRRGEGPVDPFPFVQRPAGEPATVVAELDELGEWVRTSPASVILRERPHNDAPVVSRLPRHTVVRLESASGAWYRARLPDGGTGWFSARFAEPVERPLRTERRSGLVTVREGPRATAAEMESVAPGTGVPVLGRFADYLYVQTPAGRTGWVSASGAGG
jgi:murein DD-endopeptidase MepM/ murein hydrolase activator NlpD/SH3-like domain-containing protein